MAWIISQNHTMEIINLIRIQKYPTPTYSRKVLLPSFLNGFSFRNIDHKTTSYLSWNFRFNNKVSNSHNSKIVSLNTKLFLKTQNQLDQLYPTDHSWQNEWSHPCPLPGLMMKQSKNLLYFLFNDTEQQYLNKKTIQKNLKKDSCLAMLL